MLINKFIEHLLYEMKYSPHTALAYQKDVADFEDFILPTTLDRATKRDIKSYLADLVAHKMSERSINRKLSSLKTFYKFLLMTEVVEVLPTEGVKSLKFNAKVQIPYATSEVDNLLDGSLFEDSYEGRRDKLILEVLYHTGMRRAELVQLDISQIDLEKKELKIRGKGGKTRIIPINDKLVYELRSYLANAEKGGIDLTEALFVTQKGKRIYPELVYRITKSYLSSVTKKQKKSPHMMRHSFATHLLHNGAEIKAVKEVLGHSSLAATQHYTHYDIKELKRVFNQAHPRESK